MWNQEGHREQGHGGDCCSGDEPREHGQECCHGRHEGHHGQREGGCMCGGHGGHEGHGRRFWRRFSTRDERVARLTAYLEDLRAEAQAVEERIKAEQAAP